MASKIEIICFILVWKSVTFSDQNCTIHVDDKTYFWINWGWFLLDTQWSPNMPDMQDMSGTILKCLAESSSTVEHFVHQWSMWRKMSRQRKVHRISGRKLPICWTSGSKISGRESKCPAKHWMSGTPEIILTIGGYHRFADSHLRCVMRKQT